MYDKTDRIGCAAVREQRPSRARALPLSHPRQRGAELDAVLASAVGGEQRAWELLVARFGATIHAIARRHRLSEADQDEVAQRTWLALVEHVGSVKEPAALGGWLATTARRECLRVLAAARREIPADETTVCDQPDPTSIEDVASETERREALQRALEGLPTRQRVLMQARLADPTLSLAELSAVLGMPRGSVGPTHGRSLARLRRDPHLARAVGARSIPVAPSRRARAIGHDLG